MLTEKDLTEDQKKGLKEITEWLIDPMGEDYKTLSGYAGTGKTTLLNTIVAKAFALRKRTVITAPTNKAVKVLNDNVEKGMKMTIHSLLNIKPKREKDKETFEPVTHSQTGVKMYHFDLVIIDECSMVSQKLLEYIEDQRKDTKVLFCGDPAQLQPIGESISKTFDFNPFTLTKVIRHGDAIANKAMLVRESNRPIHIQSLITEPDIAMTDKQEVSELFHNFRADPDRVRMMCWTNKRVESWNRRLRQVDWGEKYEEPFRKGDIVIANEPCVVSGDIVFMNSEEGVVASVNEDHSAWKLLVDLPNGTKAPIRVVKKEYEKNLRTELKSAAQQKDWRKYWSIRESYHDVRHAYALTTHKSQGSTFTNVVLDHKDIYKNKDIINRNQLLYVAMTRASDRVLII